MKLYAPKYYEKFKCIADKCEHSCCIGWEIDIDSNSIEIYKQLKGGYADILAESISMEETPHFKLSECDRCPHLDKQGLCRIITNLGKDYLCDICREHPRFYNYTGVAEVGIGMSCIEAARIILSSSEYDLFNCIGDVDAEDYSVGFDGRNIRQEIYALLKDCSFTYEEVLDKLYFNYDIDLSEDEKILKKLESFEYLSIEHKEMFLNFSSKYRPKNKTLNEYLKRFLAYFIYRHCTEAFDMNDFSARLELCLFCERLLAFLICFNNAETLKEVAKLASIISEEIEYSDENISLFIDT